MKTTIYRGVAIEEHDSHYALGVTSSQVRSSWHVISVYTGLHIFGVYEDAKEFIRFEQTKYKVA